MKNQKRGAMAKRMLASPDEDRLAQEQRRYEAYFCASSYVSPDTAIERCAWLDESKFVDEAYSKYWKSLKEHGDPVRAGVDASITTELMKYIAEVPSSLFPEEYARAILKYEYLRRISASTHHVLLGIMQRDDSAVRDSIDKMYETRKALPDISSGKTPSEISDEFIQCITSLSPSIMTGIDDLDKQMGGLFKGELTIMAARPGMGKTSLATAIAQNVAFDKNNNDKKVLMFSLEMSRLQLWARMACAKTGTSWKTVRSGRASQELIDKVAKSSTELHEELDGRLFIEDEIWSVNGMVDVASKLRPDLVVIDHLGEIRWDGDEDEIKWYGRATKIIRSEIARRLDCHVILIHQLNRGVEGRQDKRPILSDLRWSGDLEQLSDVVMMLYRDDYYDDESHLLMNPIVPMEIWTRKNRQGIMNACTTINFNVETQRFFPAKMPSMQIIDKTEHKWYDKEYGEQR